METCNNIRGITTNRRYPLSVKNKIYNNNNDKENMSDSKFKRLFGNKSFNISSDSENSQDFVLQVTNSIMVNDTIDENDINYNINKTREDKPSEVIVISDSSDDELFSSNRNNKNNKTSGLKNNRDVKITPSLTISSINSSEMWTEDEGRKNSSKHIFTSTQINHRERSSASVISNDSDHNTQNPGNYLSEKDLRTPTKNKFIRSESHSKLSDRKYASGDRQECEQIQKAREFVDTKGLSADRIINKLTNEGRITPNSGKFIERTTPLTKKETRKILKVVKSQRIVYDSPGQWQKNKERKYDSPGLMRDRDVVDKSELETSSSSDGSKKLGPTKFKHPAWIDETDSETSDSQEAKNNQLDNHNNCDNQLEDYKEPGRQIKFTDTRVIGYLNPIERQSLSPSERKKEDISRWLMTNAFDRQSDTSSLSIIPASQPSTPNSGDSSLERLEENYQTPNNRDKFRERINSTSVAKSDVNNPSSGGELKLAESVGKINLNTPSTEGRSKLLEKIKPAQITMDNFVKKTKARNPKSNYTPISITKTVKNLTPGSMNKTVKNITPSSVNKTVKNITPSSVNKTVKNITPSSVNKTVKNLTPGSGSNNKTKKNDTSTGTPQLRIEDCQDILTRLYGNSWRDKADDLLPKADSTPINPRSEKKLDKAKTKNHDNSRRRSDKIVRSIKPISRTIKKAPPNVKKIRDSFINDWPSSEEDGGETSYMTALTTPGPSSQTVRGRKETPMSTLQKKIIEICDSDTDDDKTPAVKDNKKRLSFGDDKSSGSFTSEYDPGDVILPRSVTKLKSFPSSKLPPATFKRPEVTMSFLKSLSADVPMDKVHPEAKKYRLNYKLTKDDLCHRLYKLYNEKIFESKLPSDMSIEWNVRMRGTAGFCYNKTKKKTLGGLERSSRIVLATKILDTPDRVRDTLVHEMCHAAAWLVNGVSDGHGPYWKSWASKAMKVFPELPPIKRCHDYKITTKFTYRCVNCGYSIGRHSKSLDIARKRCGHCYGQFELLVNRTTRSGYKVSSKHPRN
ncbi:germ cell nuclear acidic protein isoform X2 [Microplitis demolitor]|uniref:germ cell nuclear acidic protein isoform X2 n=1 Tax=Microplitis demolitor TaxID=69319 RepID=UPI0006D4C856|nr:germ cell nuclear acidic protein isoform X2 [Microplitis demolitor]